MMTAHLVQQWGSTVGNVPFKYTVPAAYIQGMYLNQCVFRDKLFKCKVYALALDSRIRFSFVINC
jgi:hypothetical protein